MGKVQSRQGSPGKHDDAGEHSNVQQRNLKDFDLAEKDLDKYLMEGVLLETFV